MDVSAQDKERKCVSCVVALGARVDFKDRRNKGILVTGIHEGERFCKV